MSNQWPERDPCLAKPHKEDETKLIPVERILQHSPGVLMTRLILKGARIMDHNLKGNEQAHPLSRRFVIHSTGTRPGTLYPFRHLRVVMEPRHSSLPLVYDYEGITLRYALSADQTTQETTGPVVVTYAQTGGVSIDHILTDSSWDGFSDPSDLRIENGELKGAKLPNPDSTFNSDEFRDLLGSMEPSLQGRNDD